MQERWSQYLTEAIDQYAIIAVTNKNGVLIHVNDLFCKVSGYKRDELLGQTHKLIKSNLHDKTFFKALWDTVLSGKIWHGEVCNKKKDGSFYWLDATIIPVLSDTGEIDSFISFRRQITGQHRIISLQNSILSTKTHCIISTNRKGLITVFNPGAEILFGISAENVIHRKHLHELMSTSELKSRADKLSKEYGFQIDASFDTLIGPVLHHGIPDQQDWEIVCQKGQKKIISLTVNEFHDNLGEFNGFMVIGHDVTKARQTQEKQNELYNRLNNTSSLLPGVLYELALHPNGTLKFPYISERINEMFGFTVDQLNHDASPLISAIHPKDKDFVLNSLEESREQLSEWKCEFRITSVFNKQHWVYGHSTPSIQKDGIILWHGFLTDITQQKFEEEEKRLSEDRYELALEGAGLGTWDWNIQTGETVFNSRWAEMLGYSLDELTPDVSSWENLVHPDDIDQVTKDLKAHLSGKSPIYETEHRVKHKDGHWVWILDKGKVIQFDQEGKPLRACGTHLDITLKKHTEHKLRYLSERDSMTDLYNRRFVDHEIARISDENHFPLGFICLDLDGLKKANDLYGHEIGDQLILLTAHALKTCFRNEDIIARMGGDEFMVLLPKTCSQTISTARRRIQKSIQDMDYSQLPVPLSISIGSAIAKSKSEIAESIQEADREMYRNKSAKNCSRKENYQ